LYDHPLLKKEDLMITTVLPVVRREIGERDKDKNIKLVGVYDDIFQEMVDKDDDLAEVD
jgi:hypothetical protein